MTLLNSSIFEEISKRIVNWWVKNKRDYPWRHERDPYKVLIAEIMLQRTKADQVVPVYLDFIKRYPTIHDLAKASAKDVETFFARLGLRWRAARVIEMAKYITEKAGGTIPDTREELLKIPMIGEYIADAILVFAYGKETAVVDSNVVRIIGRIFGIKARGEARRDPRFRKIAQKLLLKGKAREYNWAVIDFAARICTPRNPKCEVCPLKDLCRYALRQYIERDKRRK